MRHLPIFALAILATACGSKCDDAQLCVRNMGTDTIYYCWGCNYYADTLLPNGSACINVGPVSSSQYTYINFQYDLASYDILVDKCEVESVIE
ncbi:MAG: hypothetical protein K9J06_02660 [Flavobacteriales bacterium]|nr:hypothetical protein [Flavobacteriales bacterium]